MYISFTGHRDKLADKTDLDKILLEFPNSVWVHGGAVGFYRQVEMYAIKHNVKTLIIRPNYEKYGRHAPLIRNEEIIEMGELLVALFDGRQNGGTYFTIKTASKVGKPVRIIKPINL